jgi:hypothetical protein
VVSGNDMTADHIDCPMCGKRAPKGRVVVGPLQVNVCVYCVSTAQTGAQLWNLLFG